jgi:dinuclear metal center YbgI/SA1388 family protein
MNAALSDIVGYMDELLDIKNVADSPNALNGLQVANKGGVARIGAAVDAGEQTIEKAVAADVDLLLVHHGLYWGGLAPLTGAGYRKIAAAMGGDMAIYSAHLPLDVHATLGNNALMGRALRLGETLPFFADKGRYLGVKGERRVMLEELVGEVEEAVNGTVKVFPCGPEETRWIGIVTGAAGAGVDRAAAEGVDTFITGEGPHHCALMAEELGVNLLLAGHYATETYGVKALAGHVAERFGLTWVFIDHPTGL